MDTRAGRLRALARSHLPFLRPAVHAYFSFRGLVEERRSSAEAYVRKRLEQWRFGAAAGDRERARIQARRTIAMSYCQPIIDEIERWVPSKSETSNFYYDLSTLNKAHLAHFVAEVAGCTPDDAKRWIAEIESDTDLIDHIRSGLVSAYPDFEIQPYFSRRLGWYAIARALKPKIIVETGVDHGVGACVLCAALLRNQAEGYEGRYFGLDIRPDAGQLLTEPYSRVGQMLVGDSIETLSTFDKPIDLFINDSDHSSDFEAREYQIAMRHFSETSVILSDNAHVTDRLELFATETGRRFSYFHEKPVGHWYPGAGIGAAFARPVSRQL